MTKYALVLLAFLLVGCHKPAPSPAPAHESPKPQSFVWDESGEPKCFDAPCNFWRAKAYAAGEPTNVYTPYFADLEVIQTVTRTPMTTSEIMTLLDRQPNVKTVSLHTTARSKFDLETLAFPQYEHDYTLTAAQWSALQRKVWILKNESNGSAHPDVEKHWQSILDGTTPFGLHVAAADTR